MSTLSAPLFGIKVFVCTAISTAVVYPSGIGCNPSFGKTSSKHYLKEITEKTTAKICIINYCIVFYPMIEFHSTHIYKERERTRIDNFRHKLIFFLFIFNFSSILEFILNVTYKTLIFLQFRWIVAV